MIPLSAPTPPAAGRLREKCTLHSSMRQLWILLRCGVQAESAASIALGSRWLTDALVLVPRCYRRDRVRALSKRGRRRYEDGLGAMREPGRTFRHSNSRGGGSEECRRASSQPAHKERPVLESALDYVYWERDSRQGCTTKASFDVRPKYYHHLSNVAHLISFIGDVAVRVIN